MPSFSFRTQIYICIFVQKITHYMNILKHTALFHLGINSCGNSGDNVLVWAGLHRKAELSLASYVFLMDLKVEPGILYDQGQVSHRQCLHHYENSSGTGVLLRRFSPEEGEEKEVTLVIAVRETLLERTYGVSCCTGVVYINKMTIFSDFFF